MKTIEVIVAADGTTQVETKGFVGGKCQQASRFVEAALGQKTGGTLKPEFYQVRSENEVRQQQQ